MILNKVSANLLTLGSKICTRKSSSTNIYLFKVNNRNASKLTVKRPEQVSIELMDTFGHISYFFLVFLLLTLNK